MAGINSLGIAPPFIAFINSKPLPFSLGSILSQQWPYCPLPPDCLIYFPSDCSHTPLIVSLYATCGLPTLAKTLNSLFILSTIISKWSSPIPEIIVWPVSWLVSTLNVGSSLVSLFNASAIFSSSDLVAGSIAWEITGSANVICSRIIGLASSQRVSPVVEYLSPTIAPISPALSISTSSLSSACISTNLLTLSLTPFVELYTYDPALRVPE